MSVRRENIWVNGDAVVVRSSGEDDTETIEAAMQVAKNLGCSTVRFGRVSSIAAAGPKRAESPSKLSAYLDTARRRLSRREGRERGCWVYIPGALLEQSGVDPYGPPPLYRVWAGVRGSVLIRLYRPPVS